MPAIVALATLLAAISLANGEVVDDHFHRAILQRDPLGLAVSEHGMFGFLDADRTRTERLMDRGAFPWWTGDATQVSFFRPLSELTHRADYALWPDSPAMMHVHSLLWAALLAFVVVALYRRFLGARTAALAGLLYAIDDAHALPIAWIANRNAILATVFGVLALIAHDQWRRDRSPMRAFVALLCFALSLASAEAGVATCAFLFAHAVALDPARGWRRWAVLAPYALITIAWRGLCHALGYGASGSGLYIDPLHDPLRFAQAFVLRAPILLIGQWTPIPADLDSAVFDHNKWIAAIAALLVLVPLAVWLVRRLPLDATTRFFAIGMFLAVIPIAATFPSDRLLFFVGIGAMGLLARALTRGRWTWVVWVLAIVHLAIAPISFVVRAHVPAMIEGMLDPCMHVNGERDVVMVNAFDACAAYVPIRAGLENRSGPAHAWTLASGTSPITLVREDEHTLRVEKEAGWFISTPEDVFWDPGQRWGIGDRRDLDGMHVEIVETTLDGRPLVVRFRFEDFDSIRWMQVDHDGRLVDTVIPAVGHTSTIAPVY